MTEADYIATPARTGHPFTFTRIRAGATQPFLPGEGSRLHFANRATDTLEVVGVPSGFLVAGDTVTVAYLGTLVFRGEVETRIENQSRGDDATETVTVTGPWSKMARLVFRQWWRTGASGSSLSSRLILNQADDGTAQSLNAALSEIAWGSNNTGPNAGTTPTMPGGWGYQVGTINVSAQELPFDPTRDITIAQAIIRELKFFPAAVTSFDYSTTPPTLNITLPDLSGNDAAYVASIPKTARQYVYNAHPVTGVDLEIETVEEVDGVEYRNLTHQTAGNTLAGNPDCLYATLQLAGFSASSVKQKFVSEVESIANWNGIDDPGFWKAKHPYLANVPLTQGSITITNAHRSGEDTSEGITDYPNISKNTVGEIQAAGLKARVETFTCTARIVRTGGLNSGVEEIEEGVQLQMQFVTTNATNRTYTWTDSSSSTSGETVPTGLAAALLEARSGALREERFTMRLGTVAQWPKLGDICDHLVLQEFDVDLTTLTADLHFGTPDYLSPEDMAALMTGFRNKARATFSTSRVSGKPEDDATSTVDMGGVMPLSSTEFSPGVKEKITIKKVQTTRAASGSGAIVLDADQIPGGDTMDAKKLKAGESEIDAKVLSTGVLTLNGGANIKVKGEGNTITISYEEGKEPDEGAVDDGAGCNEWAVEDEEFNDEFEDFGGNGWSAESGHDDIATSWGLDLCNELNGW
ncbi:MAG: hypothetical protein IIW14_09810 [Kiritimatiellae bacterium]|nr:hypothetical protein [Kiritimatiellia bacterium]